VFGIGRATRIYLAPGATDTRKGFEGLYGLVLDRLQCEEADIEIIERTHAQPSKNSTAVMTIV
jgi:hypothetical protein